MSASLTDTAAAWIRAHAWTKTMRKTFTQTPGFYLSCACQYGPTGHCATGQHRDCHRAEPLPDDETAICLNDRPLAFAEQFQHPTRTSAVGPRRERYAMVWLADRTCRWICSCDCHNAGGPVGAQLGLFAVGRSP